MDRTQRTGRLPASVIRLTYFFLGPLFAIGALGALLVLLPPFLDIVPISFRPKATATALRQQGQRRLSVGKLTRRAAVGPQRVGRGLLVCDPVGLIPQEPQVIDQRLQRASIVAGE
jgi:hypothetical protein